MKLSEISTKDGEVIEIGKFTLLVGPNNVGKSQTLKDIHRKLIKGHTAETTLISSIKVDRPTTFEELYKGFDVRVDPINIDHHIIDGVTSDFDQQSMIRVHQLEQQHRHQFEQTPELDYTYLGLSKFRVFYMDSESRLKIASKSPNYILDENSPKNLIQALYGSLGEFDEKLKDAFQSTFGMNIKLDYSAGLELRLAVSKEFEDIPEDPRAAYPIMKKYPSIELQGDGFRSFVAVVLSLLLSKDKVVLLDEPEAFLHPEQARRLGRWISDHVEGFPCQILVATHNSNFLSGLLSGKQPADIYRLNRVNDITRFKIITSDATQALSKSPILSSQRVLEAIFSQGVVVCESDTDRIIYSSVAIHVHGKQEILFIHAHNKQTIKDVVKLLTDASVPTVAIIDIDILNSATDLSNAISAFCSELNQSEIISLRAELATHIEEVSEENIIKELEQNVAELLKQLNNNEHSLSGARGALNRIRAESTKWSKIKRKGIDTLEVEFRQKAQKIIDESMKVGLYIVPVGELESWMDLGVRKNRWVLPALQEIHEGRCPDNLKMFVGGIINGISNH
jgi:energy-coupling factor transporter ATP-binding protein EcfA2